LGTALIWLALTKLEKQARPLSIKEKYDHWQAELLQVQTELKGAQFLANQYQAQVEQLRQELSLAPQAVAPVLPTPQTQVVAPVPEMPAAQLSEQALQSQFLATLSHEIRTPMNGLVGMTQLALQTELTAQQREFIELANQSAKHLMNIINDVLDYSKIQAGHLSLDLRPCHPVDVMHQTLRSFYPQAGAKGLTLYYEDLPNTAPPMLMDPLRLRQVLSNLIGNAIKFTHQGFVQTSMHLSPSDSPGQWNLSFVVQDSGIGIAMDRQKQIFAGFEYADVQTNRQYGGTGLGLSICERLVSLQGGSLGVSSVQGIKRIGMPIAPTITCQVAPKN
jgi:signal transduction histidine kinase